MKWLTICMDGQEELPLGRCGDSQFITEGEQTTSKESTAILIKNFTSSQGDYS